MPLFLLSSLLPHIRALPELKEICKLKCQLHEPQADDALVEVWGQHRIIQGLWLFKQLNVSGTGNRPNTQMLSLYQCEDLDDGDDEIDEWEEHKVDENGYFELDDI